MPSPVENLLILQKAAQAGAVPKEVATWLNKGIDDYLCRKNPLDKCLQLQGGRGIRRALTKYLRQQRDYHLRQAWALLDEPKPWPRWCELDQPPPGTSALRQALFAAFKTGFQVPGGVGQLHKICGADHNRKSNPTDDTAALRHQFFQTLASMNDQD